MNVFRMDYNEGEGFSRLLAEESSQYSSEYTTLHDLDFQDNNFTDDIDDLDSEEGNEEDNEMISDSEEEEEGGSDSIHINFDDLVLDGEVEKAVRQRRSLPKYADRLTDEFKLLMGEANLCLGKGDRKAATNICLEIIRNIPDSPAPYETLSVIFEEENDLYKSLQYGLISAHLWPADPLKWYNLAQKCTELQDVVNLEVCMAKALRYSYLLKDKSFIEDILNYYESKKGGCIDLDIASKMMIGYKKLIKVSENKDRKALRDLLSNFRGTCLTINATNLWVKVIVVFCLKYNEEWTDDIICEVGRTMNAAGQHGKLLLILVNSKRIEVISTLAGDDIEQDIVSRVSYFKETPTLATKLLSKKYKLKQKIPDLMRGLLVACLIHLQGEQENIDEFAKPLLTDFDPNSSGEELLLIANAYFDMDQAVCALSIYETLTKSTHVEDVFVWNRLAVCLEKNGEWKMAVKAYETILSIDEANEGARLGLFSLQKQHINDDESAFRVNIHCNTERIKDLSERPDVIKLCFFKTCELISEEKFSEAYDEGAYTVRIAIQDCITVSCGDVKGTNTNLLALSYFRNLMKNQNLGVATVEKLDKYLKILPKISWYNWYIGITASALHLGKVKDAFTLTLAAYCSRLLDEKQLSKNISIHCILLAALSNNVEYLSEAIGQTILPSQDLTGIWNMFYLLHSKLPQQRTRRLTLRMFARDPNNYNTVLANAINTLYSRNFKACVVFFRHLLYRNPNNDQVYFYLALLYLQFATNTSAEYIQRRHELVIQALSCMFMYQDLRGPCQETYYNVGRCFHQLTFYHHALTWYEKALRCAPSLPKKVQDDMKNTATSFKAGADSQWCNEVFSPCTVGEIDYSLEAAYNIAQIYKATGAEHLARTTLYQHAVI